MFKVREEYEIKNSILGAMENELSKIEGSYNYDTAAATAVEINQLYKDTEWLSQQLFPWSVTDDYYLDLHMKSFGLTRRGKTKASGEVTFTGKAASLVKIGSVVISRTGQRYSTMENCILDGTGKGTVKIEAEEGGEIGNCGTGDINNFEIVISNVTAVTNLKPVTGGYEIESIDSCKERMHEKASRPAHSGNVYDYENWAKAVGGIGKVRVISAGEHGVLPGQVKVLIADYEFQPATSELVDNVQNYINGQKPINDDATVESFTAYTMNITFDTVRVNTSLLSKEEFIAQFTEKLSASLLDLNFTYGDVLSLAKIGVLALQIDGVLDYDSLEINGLSSNIQLGYNRIPTLGNITVSNYVEA